MRPLACLAALGTCAIAAEVLPKGQVVDRVVCSGEERQSYALYLPAQYAPERTWPILYCLDPPCHESQTMALFDVASSGGVMSPRASGRTTKIGDLPPCALVM